MAKATDNTDDLCREFFRLCVESEEGGGGKLSEAARKQGGASTVKKILTEMGESAATISHCQTRLLTKHQNKTTKKISDEDFFKKVLPEVAANKVKVMGVADRRVQIELNKMKVKLCRKLEEKKKIQGVEKNEQAVPELTPKLPEPALKPSVIDTRFRELYQEDEEDRGFIMHQAMHAPRPAPVIRK